MIEVHINHAYLKKLSRELPFVEMAIKLKALFKALFIAYSILTTS